MQMPGVLPGGDYKPVTHEDGGLPCAPAPWGPSHAHRSPVLHSTSARWLPAGDFPEMRLGFFLFPLSLLSLLPLPDCPSVLPQIVLAAPLAVSRPPELRIPPAALAARQHTGTAVFG